VIGDSAIDELKVTLQSKQLKSVWIIAFAKQADFNGQIGSPVTKIDQGAVCRFIGSHVHSNVGS
jgi:hypothetical protein